MFTLKNPITPTLLDELKTRVNIGIFMVLSIQLARVIFKPIEDGMLILLVFSLVEILTMAIIYKFCQDKNIGNDINELNCYALLWHIVWLPLYKYTDIPLSYHNNVIWIIFFLALARLSYFGETNTGDFVSLPNFGLLAFFQKHFSKVIKKASNHWPTLLFFGSALPLWFILWRTNDPMITATTIGLMLYIYFITDRMPKAPTFNERKAAALAFFEEFRPVVVDESDKVDKLKETVFDPAKIDKSKAGIPWDDDDQKTFIEMLLFILEDNPRSIMAQMVYSICKTNPKVQNILLTFSNHFARSFENKGVLSDKERRDYLLCQLIDSQENALCHIESEGNLTSRDYVNLMKIFTRCFDGRLVNIEINTYLDTIAYIDFNGMPDNDFNVITDNLMRCWTNLILNDSEYCDDTIKRLSEVSNKAIKTMHHKP